MTNKEFIIDLAGRTNKTQKEVSSLVNATISAIIGELTEENSVAITGFG
ncbi:MAG: HU family DNA-binding protein, partial [Prevotella sp.]